MRKNMRNKFLALTLLLAGGVAAPAFAQPSVGVSIGIRQPGVYGRIDIGNYPPPELVYPQPVVVVPGPIAVQRPPIYLYVPPLYQQDWRRYCGRYNACNQPVYFVQDRWVRERWSHEHPHWREERRGHFDRGHPGRPEGHRDNGRHGGHDDHRGHDDRGGHRGH